MTIWRSICSLIGFFILTHALATVDANEHPHPQGRKLFGGYRIVPRACRPSITLPQVSEEPAICMFNYECSQRNGQVVGACMDGFLFGACCQLPPKNSSDRVNVTYDEDSSPDIVLNIQELDHVPDVPILLNPDGTPIISAISESSLKTPSPTSSTFDDLNSQGTAYTKIPTFTPDRHTTSAASPISIHHNDETQNAEKTQIPTQLNFSEVEDNYPILIGQPQIYDDLRLPSLLSHSDSHNDIQEQPETVAVNPIATILSPDQIFQIADPVDQLPALFSHGLGQSNYTVADTILLNENGTMLNETYNPDDLFKPSTVTMDMKRVTQTYSSASTDSRNKVTPSSIKPLSTTTKISSSTTKIKSTTPKISTERTKVTSTPIKTTSTTKTNNEKKKTTPTTTKSQGTSSSTSNWVKFTGQSSSSSSSLLSSTTEMNKISATNTQLTSEKPMMTQMYEDNQKVTSMAQDLHSIPTTFDKMPTVEEKVSSHNIDSSAMGNEAATTPMTSLYPDHDDELVRVPTINSDMKTGNKKDDVLDKEEIAINHIISILNNTTPGSEGPVTAQGPSSSIHTWISVNEPAKPVRLSTPKPVTTNKFNYTFYKPTRGSSSTLSTKTSSTTEKYTYTFYKPIKPSTYYNYEIASTETNYPFHSTSNTFHSRPSTYFIHGSSSPSPSTLSSSSLTPSSSLSSSASSSSLSPSSSFSSTSSTSPGGSSFGYSSRPTTNPPAPTVIVLGPLGTEFTSETTQKNRTPTPSTVSISSKPTVSSTGSTKKPSVSTTITHNISTIISTAIKDSDQLYTKSPVVHTTISSWSNKPIFNLKPSSPNFNWPDGNQSPVDTISIAQESSKPVLFATTETDSYEDDTSVPNNLILDEVLMSFPPVRNPNLNTSVPVIQQEKPTIVETFNNTGYPEVEMISENEIPTPAFIEDNVLTNKVDEFVQKIVQSLQGNFQDLKDIVYNSNNGSVATPSPTRRPTGASTTKKPVRRPTTAKPATPTRKPTPTRRPATSSQKPVSATSRPRPTSNRPKPSGSATTQKPQTPSKRPKPTKIKPTTSPTTITTVTSVNQALDTNTLPTTQETITTSTLDYRTQCGIRPLLRNGRIVGGKASQFGEWPWQVLVREATWLGLFTKNKCGGVLITDRYVITAAHCQPGFLASLVAVFGEYDISGELERKRSISRNVRRVIVYKDYNPSTFENDLALLELESPVQFDEHIVPICLPRDGADFTGQMATVTGWGRLKYNGGVPSMLQEVKVPIMENAVCQEMFQTAGHSKLILDSFLCAGYANGQKDSCEGDSGGPLVIEGSDGRWTLVGTVSHGIKCAAPYLPGVYMRTTYYKPWLHAITGV